MKFYLACIGLCTGRLSARTVSLFLYLSKEFLFCALESWISPVRTQDNALPTKSVSHASTVSWVAFPASAEFLCGWRLDN